nr:MAG TPA: hypothetical protein [Inoviridae sp.]
MFFFLNTILNLFHHYEKFLNRSLKNRLYMGSLSLHIFTF